MVRDSKVYVTAVLAEAVQPEPDSVLPTEYCRSRRKLSPEERLMMAVLQNAINCLEEHRLAARPPGRRLFDEVKQWFLAPEGDWPYSFEYICAVLDLDADAVRQSIRLAADQRPAARVIRHARRSTRIVRRVKSEPRLNKGDWDEV